MLCAFLLAQVAINFTHDNRSRQQLKSIETTFGKPIVALPIDDLDKVSKIVHESLKA